MSDIIKNYEKYTEYTSHGQDYELCGQTFFLPFTNI